MSNDSKKKNGVKIPVSLTKRLSFRKNTTKNIVLQVNNVHNKLTKTLFQASYNKFFL